MGLAARAAMRPSALLRPINVGFLTPHNPHDLSAFSGTAHAAWQALSQQPGVKARLLGAHKPMRFQERLVRKLKGAPAASVTVDADEFEGLDAVVGLVATKLVDYLPRDLPYLHVTDATPGFLAEFYGSNGSAEATRRELHAVRRASITVYSSEEMVARSKTELFGRGPIQAVAVPFGVNLEPSPFKLPRRTSGRFKMLMVASNWSRKGGEIALQALRQLRSDGVDADLTVVGDMPKACRNEAGVSYAGWLNKAKPRQLRRLQHLMACSDVFVLPTRADCTPMVLAEAMAHGLPVVATDIGGIRSLVTPATGRLLPLSAGAPDWAGVLRQLAEAPEERALMAEAGVDRATTRLSWSTWATDIAALTRSVVVGAAAERSHIQSQISVHS